MNNNSTRWEWYLQFIDEEMRLKYLPSSRSWIWTQLPASTHMPFVPCQAAPTLEDSIVGVLPLAARQPLGVYSVLPLWLPSLDCSWGFFPGLLLSSTPVFLVGSFSPHHISTLSSRILDNPVRPCSWCRCGSASLAWSALLRVREKMWLGHPCWSIPVLSHPLRRTNLGLCREPEILVTSSVLET